MPAVQKIASIRKLKRNRTTLLSSAKEKDINLLNQRTKSSRSLSNFWGVSSICKEKI
ncbi:hypothetical protein [Robertmurraya siralis]|uniref:hypothetical protein n=1 Tax=Robertmurraya siralis TaxID=77777 RepID=UPI001476AD1B|nr:hypothetical protein [Robertmurraya siralis]